MSSLAVFLVLGGATAFAATQLPKKSVGTKQLKKNAVTTAKIKKNAVTTARIKKEAVTGAKINKAKLGAVPLAESLPPLEATHLVGASGEPPFESGAENLPGTPPLNFNPVGFYKDHEGIVHLQGIAKLGTGPIFTLPAGFRPASERLVLQEPVKEDGVFIFGSNVVSGELDLSGKVLGTGATIAILDGITFRAES